MTGRRSKFGWMCALLFPIAAHGQVDLTGLDREMSGPRAHVLVLGSEHLARAPGEFDKRALVPLLDRLASFKPDIITIEALSGEECDFTLRHPALYPPDERFCKAPDAARTATGLDVPSAIAEVHAMLKDWPSRPAPSQRRKLASRFLAANDPASAYVQWLQLPPTERRAGDGMDEALAAMMEKLGTRASESFAIGATLAARLGLQRVYPIDNHTGDNLQITDEATFAKDMQAAWDSDHSFEAVRKRMEALTRERDLLPLYRFINSPETTRLFAENEVLPSLRAKSAQGYPQMWVGAWEIRNLRMVANIRETFRERPGARVLSIVGSSHKPWFDAWLGQLQGVEIVDATQVLK